MSDSNIDVDDFLEHFGVKGMHWGVRKTPGVSNRVNRMASKDAQEHARAKLFFGEGAGTRRKLINARVDHNRKFVPGYGKAFDAHLSSQDLSKHSIKAVKERHSIDRKDRNKKRAGAVARRLTGEWGTQAAFVALAGSGVAFARSDRGQRFMQKTVSKIKSGQAEVIRRKGARHIQRVINNMS
jgi:hypothetical protein